MPTCEHCDQPLWTDGQGQAFCYACVLFYYGHARMWADEAHNAPPPVPPRQRIHFLELDPPRRLPGHHD